MLTDMPIERYLNTDPDCKPGRRFLIVARMPEEKRSKDAAGKPIWKVVYGVPFFMYGRSAEATEAKLRDWLIEQQQIIIRRREARRKTAVRAAKQQERAG